VPKLYIVNLWRCQQSDNFGLAAKTYLQQSFLCTKRAFKALMKNCPMVVIIAITRHKVNVRYKWDVTLFWKLVIKFSATLRLRILIILNVTKMAGDHVDQSSRAYHCAKMPVTCI
jgi:hypothetical protein